jgi:cell division protein ZapA
MVNARAYTIACDEGEEEHLKELATHVDAKVRELLSSVGQVGDQRLILMAALLIADEHHEAVARLEALTGEMGSLSATREDLSANLEKSEMLAANALEAATKRIEDIAGRLARA